MWYCYFVPSPEFLNSLTFIKKFSPFSALRGILGDLAHPFCWAREVSVLERPKANPRPAGEGRVRGQLAQRCKSALFQGRMQYDKNFCKPVSFASAPTIKELIHFVTIDIT